MFSHQVVCLRYSTSLWCFVKRFSFEMSVNIMVSLMIFIIMLTYMSKVMSKLAFIFRRNSSEMLANIMMNIRR